MPFGTNVLSWYISFKSDTVSCTTKLISRTGSSNIATYQYTNQNVFLNWLEYTKYKHVLCLVSCTPIGPGRRTSTPIYIENCLKIFFRPRKLFFQVTSSGYIQIYHIPSNNERTFCNNSRQSDQQKVETYTNQNYKETYCLHGVLLMMYITTSSKTNTNTNTNTPVLKIVLKVGQQFYFHHLAFALI